MDIDATSPVASSQIPQKRVLPSRLRRGGPGVGNCEVDVMILNIQMNKSMEAPLIPTESPFFMTTDGSLEEIAREFSPAPTVNPPVHSERPEVMEAYRQKAVIETPEYQDVSDVPTTDGRLRTRLPAPTDDKTIILSDSDAVYEKRHKKYETFEKRQRLREKEKLKHEQYKLKERIEQLRAMDNSAFLAAPASSFSPRPQLVEDDGEDIGAPSSHPNGASAYNEGERRRKEMLLNAQTLEERYRILLPPERPHQRRPAGQSSLNVSTDPESELVAKDYPLQEDGESELDEGFTAQREIPKIRLPATLIPRTTSTSSKKRRRSSIPPPALPSLHRSPAAPRRARAGPSLIGDTSPALLGPSLLQAQSSPGSSGLSSGVDVVSGFRHMRYETDSQPGKVVKQARQRGGRPGQPARKKAKTEEGGLPSSHDHSVPSGQSFDDDQIPHKRSSSPHQHESYSFPPPPPPPESWQPFPESFPPPSSRGTTPDPIVSSLPLAQISNSGSPPPDRKASVPPIESISAPVQRRGGRPRAAAQPPPRKHRGRARGTEHKPKAIPLLVFAERNFKNTRQKRNNRAFAVPVIPILLTRDEYEFELPPTIFNSDHNGEDQDRDGTMGPEDAYLGEQDEPADLEDPDEQAADVEELIEVVDVEADEQNDVNHANDVNDADANVKAEGLGDREDPDEEASDMDESVDDIVEQVEVQAPGHQQLLHVGDVDVWLKPLNEPFGSQDSDGK